MTPRELEKYIGEYLSAFLKECPICKSLYKDFLDEIIIYIHVKENRK